jgi:hypothetical protein
MRRNIANSDKTNLQTRLCHCRSFPLTLLVDVASCNLPIGTPNGLCAWLGEYTFKGSFRCPAYYLSRFSGGISAAPVQFAVARNKCTRIERAGRCCEKGVIGSQLLPSGRLAAEEVPEDRKVAQILRARASIFYHDKLVAAAC